MEIKFSIKGQPYSKANNRIPVRMKSGRQIWIKNAKAQKYLEEFIRQAPKNIHFTKPVKLICTIVYESNRPDLDESLIMDGLQKSRILKNDRQIVEKHIYKAVPDKNCPQAIIKISDDIADSSTIIS